MRGETKDDYGDIAALPHHVSERRAHMAMIDRAAQFAPFAALTGYEDDVREVRRLTRARVAPGEDQRAALDARLAALCACEARRPWAEITYFQPDARKAGGAYRTVRGRVRRVDGAARVILLDDGTAVPIADILEIETDPAQETETP